MYINCPIFCFLFPEISRVRVPDLVCKVPNWQQIGCYRIIPLMCRSLLNQSRSDHGLFSQNTSFFYVTSNFTVRSIFCNRFGFHLQQILQSVSVIIAPKKKSLLATFLYLLHPKNLFYMPANLNGNTTLWSPFQRNSEDVFTFL